MMEVLVSWDDEIPNTVYEKIKVMFQTTRLELQESHGISGDDDSQTISLWSGLGSISGLVLDHDT